MARITSRKYKRHTLRRAGAFFCAAFFLLSVMCSVSICAFPRVDSLAAGEDAASADSDSGQSALSYIPSYEGLPVITGTTSYLSSSSVSDSPVRFFYSDGYFSESAITYDKHLASASLCFAGSAMASSDGGEKDYKNKSKNARSFLDKIGCTDVCVNGDFVVQPGEDTIGIVLARKTIEIEGQSYTLVPIGIRGAGYEKEWIGNMKVGASGDSEGFKLAADRAKKAVDTYIKKYNIDTSKTKFWIAGFSRAGAVADMLTARLTDEYDPTGTNVYGYSFATPMGAYEKKRSYPNSHCTINTSDVVPSVVPEFMGFSHYGDDVDLDDPDNGFHAYTMSVSYAVDIGPVTVPDSIDFNETDRFPDQQTFISELMKALQESVVADRNEFANKKFEGGYSLESILSWIMKFFMTSDEKHIAEVTGAIADFQNQLGFKGLLQISFMLDAIHEGISTLDIEDREEIYATLWAWFKPGLQSTLTEDEFNNIGGMWKSMVYILFELAHYDYENSGAEGFALIGTMMKNASIVGAAHTPDEYLKLVQGEDDFYSNISQQTTESVKAFDIEDPSTTEAVFMKNDSPVAVVNGGRTMASKDPGVYAARPADEPSDLKPSEDGALYANENTDTKRGIFVDKNETYRVELTALDRSGEKLEFEKWVDEKGTVLSEEPTYTMDVAGGNSQHEVVKAVYREMPEPTPTPSAETPEQKEEGSSGWPWILGLSLVGAGGVAGGGYVVYRKKRKRSKKH